MNLFLVITLFCIRWDREKQILSFDEVFFGILR